MQSFSCVDFIWESAQLRAAASATLVGPRASPLL